MKETKHSPIHALEIPTGMLPLLVPSACVAEVATLVPIESVPRSPAWMMGVVGWRSKPVSVVSIEVLMGGTPGKIGARSKIIVFYPLPGRPPTDFFGIVAASDPQSRTVDSTVVADTKDITPNAFIASYVRLERGIVGIPDFDALKRAFYPT
jgi:chemotaxis signal transduction protein